MEEEKFFMFDNLKITKSFIEGLTREELHSLKLKLKELIGLINEKEAE